MNKEKIYILVAEADLRKRGMIVEMLRNAGYRHFDTAADGAAAFNILKRRPIDVIISAWDMPMMNGLALLKVVSMDEELFRIPFLMVSKSINREMVVEAGKYGVASILLDPLNQATLDEKIESVLTASPDEQAKEAENLFRKAKALITAGRYDEALAVYREILEHTETADIYYNIGYIKTAQGKYDEAIIAFRKAVMIDNMHARAFNMMGKVYLKKGEPAEAEKYFEKAGEIFLERNMDGEAEAAFKEVLKINPKTVNIYNSLGIIYRRQHKYKQAIDLYNMAISVDPEDENLFYNLGRAYLENKEVEEARKVFEHALVLNPRFEEAKRMLQAIDVGFSSK